MFIQNVVHAFVDWFCKGGRWKCNVEVLLFLTISSVIDRIEASWNLFCVWCPWKAIPVQVWVSLFFLVAGGIHVDFPYWDCGTFQGVIVHRHLQEYFYKNYTIKLIHLSASILGVSLSWEPCITEFMQWRMCVRWHIKCWRAYLQAFLHCLPKYRGVLSSIFFGQ